MRATLVISRSVVALLGKSPLGWKNPLLASAALVIGFFLPTWAALLLGISGESVEWFRLLAIAVKLVLSWL